MDSLEREYKREDIDWFSRASISFGGGSEQDKLSLVSQLINKHQEQKEAFLKACTLARRTAETFLKYSNRNMQYFSHPATQSTFRGPDSKVKGGLKLPVFININYSQLRLGDIFQ